MTELDQLRDTFLAIPLEDVKHPDIPVSIDFQEIQDLLTYVETQEGVLAELDSVGLLPETIPAVRLGLAAAQQAQTQWSLIRDPRKPEDQAAAEESGRKLRSTAVSAGRFTLRKDRSVQRTLDRIVQGNTIADLVQDLFDLAALVNGNLDGFKRNRKFNAPAQVDLLTTAANDIRLGLSEFRTDEHQKKAVELRNRAWTWLDDQVDELREAGRHAYVGTPTALEFGSAYERRQRTSRRRRGSEGTPVDPLNVDLDDKVDDEIENDEV